jgi:hypothetical protein
MQQGTLVGIQLMFADGNGGFTIQTLSVGPQSTTIQTPFGVVDLAKPAPKAPTGPEVAANPSAFDGTSWDPSLYGLPLFFDGEQVRPTWAEEMKYAPEQGRAILKAMLKAVLDETKLTVGQRKRLGLT